MNTPLDINKPATTANKPLWAAVIVLGVAVLGMAATLIRIQTKPEEPRLAVLSAPAAPASATPAPAVAAPVVSVTPAPMPVTASEPRLKPKQTVASVQHAQAAPKSIAPVKAADRPAYEAAPPAAQVAKPICANCGTVESVTPIQREGTGSGGGAVAGGVLGALVGNQFGGGQGKDLSTILGAIGGGIAGNAVEKKMKKETVYQVQVRMEDGSLRTLEQAMSASVGAKVLVDGNSLQPFSR